MTDLAKSIVCSPEAQAAVDKIASVLNPLKPKQRRRVIENVLREDGLQAQSYWSGYAGAAQSFPMAVQIGEPKAEDRWDKKLGELAPHVRDEMISAIGADRVNPSMTFREAHRQLENKQTDLEKRKRQVERRDKKIKRIIAALESLKEWVAEPILQKQTESVFHHCIAAVRDGNALIADKANEGVPLATLLSTSMTSFLVQHNWVGAFAKAKDFAGGDLRLPYDASCFEFKISDHYVCAFVLASEGSPGSLLLFARTKPGWLLLEILDFKDGKWMAPESGVLDLIDIVTAQIYAISVALDAEVLITEAVRAPHKSNVPQKASPDLPLYECHTISLAHRRRAAALPRSGGEPMKRRLHFRRGHWRHYPNHKTWIKWMLVGNPDLGFIDKRYSL